MKLQFNGHRYIVSCTYEERNIPKKRGFTWDEEIRKWYTYDPYIAYGLYYAADAETQMFLDPIRNNIILSTASYPVFEGDPSEYAFQAAGVEVACSQLRYTRNAVLLADEQGLGKTVEAIQIANTLGYKKLLVICPASLRLNWLQEIKTWHVDNPGAEVVLTGKHKIDHEKSLIVSYALANIAKKYTPDFIICDEAHYVKNVTTKRTQLILGSHFFQIKSDWRGLVEKAPTILLTGTPTPNGRPNELWVILARLAPEILGSFSSSGAFMNRYCIWKEDPGTNIVRILGSKNLAELYVRLRGSGFMVRRLKKDVLKYLPPKRYKLVIFPENAMTKKILEQEKNFSAEDILKHGVPVGSVLPTLRREMGIAKTPQCIEYINDYLEGGDEKIVLFAHHLEVVGLLAQGLKRFGVVVITGSTSAGDRQRAVNQFQTDPAIRIFIGNAAAEEGWTLTAAHDVVLVEPEWVPGQNDQRADRLHRIGQTRGVIVHLLVVEGSLDAAVLGSAAHKAENIETILGKGVE